MTPGLQPVGTWIDESFSRLKDRVVTLTLIGLFGGFMIVLGVVAVYALGFAIFGFMYGWDNLLRIAMDPTKLGYLVDESRGAVAMLNLLAAFVGLRLYCWTFLGAVHASLEPSPRVFASLAKGKGRGYAFLLLFVVQQIVLNVGMALLIVPGLILAVWLGFACWAFARERVGAFASLGASARAVKGHFFAVLGRMLLAGLIGGAMMIVPILGWIVGPAWMLVAWGALYDQLRSPATPQPARPPRPQPSRPINAQPAAVPQR